LLVLRSLFEGAEVLVIDPESEYERLAQAVGGTVIRLRLHLRLRLGAGVRTWLSQVRSCG
ncbi:MAG TPA: hypothetical protein VEV82_04300, partial [Actinomycetota bacterium]|nr:hypothetical protein [Actinomycetota bacterium]